MKSSLDVLLSMIAHYLVVFLFVLSFDYLYHTFVPVQNWLDYHSVEPIEEAIDHEDGLYFLSNSTVKKDVSVEFNDVLYCRHGSGDFRYYSNYNSSVTLIPSNGRKNKPRRYGSPIPERESVCYLRAEIISSLRYGIVKTEIIKSGLFTIL